MVHSLYLPKKKKLGTTLLSTLAYKIAFLSPLHILKSVRTFKINENSSSPPYKPKEYFAFVLSDLSTVNHSAGKQISAATRDERSF